MILECPSCQAKYKVDASLIPAQGKKVRCKKCQSIFKASQDGQTELLKSGAPPAPEPKPETKPQPQAAATVMIDSAQIQAMVANTGPVTRPETPAQVQVDQPQIQATPEPERKAATDFSSMGENSEEFTKPDFEMAGYGTVRMQTIQDPSAFATQGMPVQKMDPPKPPKTASFTDESPMFSEMDQFDFGIKPQAQEPEPQPDFTSNEQPEPEFDSNTIFSDTPVFDVETAPSEPVGFANIELEVPPEPVAPVAPSISPAPMPQAPAPHTFKAKIDQQIYPSLTLDVIERWVREGRLLETDEMALEHSQEFRRADTFPEIQGFFRQYFGNGGASKPAQKKGFFARLFGK